MESLTDNGQKIYGVLETIADGGSATFAVAVSQCSAQGLSYRGEIAITWPEDWGYNHILWTGVNQDFFDALQRLVAKRGLLFRSTTPLVYMADGAILELPIAKPRKSAYRDPHWLPVVFETKVAA